MFFKQVLLKISQYCELKIFFIEQPWWLLLHFFFKKVLKKPFFKGVNLNRLIKKCPCFSTQQILDIIRCIKSRTCLFVNFTSIVRFSKYLRQGVPIKLKIATLQHMNNTFRNAAFQVSVDVPLNHDSQLIITLLIEL